MAFDIIEAGRRVLPTEEYLSVPNFNYHTLAFEMNLDLQTADRDVYNALDWVREMGGF